jgi:hypothetical protein
MFVTPALIAAVMQDSCTLDRFVITNARHPTSLRYVGQRKLQRAERQKQEPAQADRKYTIFISE